MYSCAPPKYYPVQTSNSFFKPKARKESAPLTLSNNRRGPQAKDACGHGLPRSKCSLCSVIPDHLEGKVFRVRLNRKL